MTRTGDKFLTVKDWFAEKIAKDLSRKIDMCDVFAILKETDKAVYAMLNIGVYLRKTMWIPKSVLIEEDPAEHGDNRVIYTDDYDLAVLYFKNYWSDFV